MSLNTYWQNAVDTGGGITSVLATDEYTYCAVSGMLYCLDNLTGGTVASYPVYSPGEGVEVRLAQSEDSAIIFAAMNGYLSALSAVNLNFLWQFNLQGAGYNITSVVAGPNCVYTASNGLLFQVTLSGSLIASNNLTGMGNSEVRLALSDDESILYAGSNGYVSAVPASNVGGSYVWGPVNLTDSGWNIVSVASLPGACIAGCNGYVSVLSQSSGNVTATNDLSGMGHNEVRLAVDFDQQIVYVGTDGYVWALMAANLSTVWSQSLPSCGYQIVDLAGGDNGIYAGSNGYVYQLDQQGTILFQNDLSGLGFSETRVSVAPNQIILAVGINGTALGLNISDLPTFSGAWMGAYASQIGDTPLAKLAIPGSHDSGTYNISFTSAIGEDLPPYVPYVQSLFGTTGVVASDIVIANWSIAQNLTFGEQLELGIRYFDLRLQASNGVYSFVHGMVSAPLSDLFAQVNSYLQSNSQEIVLLDFNHFYGFGSSDYVNVTQQILSAFGGLLIPSTVGSQVTPNQLWAGTGRIIVFFDNPNGNTSVNLWPASAINSPWPDVQSMADLFTALSSELPNTSSQFFVLQGQLTPNAGTVALGLLPGSNNPDSLYDQAAAGNSILSYWFTNNWASSGVNIVIADFVEMSSFVSSVIGLNVSSSQARSQQLRPASAIDTARKYNARLSEMEKTAKAAYLRRERGRSTQKK